MNWCKIGIHKYEHIKTETAKNIVDGFSGCIIMRAIEKCNKCGKTKIIPLNITSKQICYDDSLKWK